MLTDYHVHLRPDDPGLAGRALLHAANAERYRESAAEKGIAELGVAEHIHRFYAGARRSGTTRSGASAAPTTSTPTAPSCARRPTCGSGSRPTSSPAARTASRTSSTPTSGTTSSARCTSCRTAPSTCTASATCGAAASRPSSLWKRYFDTLAEAARTGLYDIMAHPDLVKVWGRRRRGGPCPRAIRRRYYEPAVEAFADAGVAIEVSTAGLRKPDRGDLPGARLPRHGRRGRLPDRALQRRPRARALGHGYDRALELLADAGVPSSACSRAARGAWSPSADPLTGIGVDSHRFEPDRPLDPRRRRHPARAGPRRPLGRRRPHPRDHRRAARRRRPRRHRPALPRHRPRFKGADSLEFLRTSSSRLGRARHARPARRRDA